MKLYLSSSKRKLVSPLAQLALVSSLLIANSSFAQTAPPPNLGDETKGEPAIEESVATDANSESQADTESSEAENKSGISRATVVESRRENGQVYSIELQHSNAPNQYIEETDSDGNIEFKSNDLEETPNLPKWKLGSW